MNDSQATAPLTMRWTPETDESGRTRMVAHWVTSQPAAKPAISATAAPVPYAA